MATGASENGSDGTIRAASASLDSVKLGVNFSDPANPHVSTIHQKNDPPVFKLVDGCNHSTIPNSNATANHLKIILQCLSVKDATAYDALRNTFDAANRALYQTNQNNRATNKLVDPINRFQQFIVRVLDTMRNAVTDYRLTST